MLVTQAILGATIVGNLWLLLVVMNERPSLIRTVFALYVAFTAAWALSIYLNLFLGNLFVEDWVFATAAAMLTAQVWFAKLFPEGKLPHKLGEYWSLAIGCLFVGISFYPGALFHTITLRPHGYTILDTGFLSVPYSLFAFAYVWAPIFIVFKKYRSEPPGALRQQLRSLAIGWVLFAGIAVLTNSVLPVFFGIYQLNAVGPSLSLVFATFAFYSIKKHELLDIRKAVLRGVMYSFLIAVVVVAYELCLLAAERYFAHVRPILTWEDDVVEPVSAALVTAVGMFTIPFIERYFQKKTDRIFFKDRYDYASAVESLSLVLQESVHFDELVERIERRLAEILRAESVQLFIFDANGSVDIETARKHELLGRELLYEPVCVGGKNIGGILVGEKRSGDTYTLEDAQLLRTFSMQASTALARVQLFMQVRRHADELEQKVIERTEELRRTHERERQSMFDIAHSLQTPLAVLRTKLDRLRSSSGSTGDLEPLEQSFENLSGFIADLLKLAHLEYAKGPELKDVDVSGLIVDLCDEADIVALPLGIAVTRAIEPEIAIRGDEREVRLALLNLLANAIKYMRQEGPKELHIGVSSQQQHAIITVRDTGIGISREDLGKIFNRFYRSGITSERGGSGLGLAITKAIVERHGGSIEAISALHEGTTIVIRFPLLRIG